MGLTVKLLALRRKVPDERFVLAHDPGIVSLGPGELFVGNCMLFVQAPLLALEVPHLDLKSGNMVVGCGEGGERGRKVIEIENALRSHCDRCCSIMGNVAIRL